MMQPGIHFTSSPWYILLCLLIGGVYSWLLYTPKSHWSKSTNIVLALLRASLVSLICFLLLAPLIRTTSTQLVTAKTVIAIDNSSSLAPVFLSEQRAKLNEWIEKLQKSGLQVAVESFQNNSTSLADLSFQTNATNLTQLLSTVQSNYEDSHLTDVVLISDGIHNQGTSPLYFPTTFKLHAVGIGDTIPNRDVFVKNIQVNRIAFLNNKFPIQADIVAQAAKGEQVMVTVLHQGRKVAQQSITIDEHNFFRTIQFEALATAKGLQRYTISVTPVSNEKNIRNNTREVGIEVIDGREKILLVALTPHPDIKAIRSILQQSENYELEVIILSQTNVAPPSGPYDLIIAHQLPDQGQLAAGWNDFLFKSKTPLLLITGNQTSVPLLNTLQTNLKIVAPGHQRDRITAHFNPDFSLVNLDPVSLSLLERLPPVSAPYGDYTLTPGAEVILFQRLGNTKTNKPLFVYQNTAEKKMAFFLGDGLWQWRLEEYALTEKHEIVDALFQKVFQLMAAKDDHRKFRVTPISNEISRGDAISFKTEIYNDIFEEQFGNEVALRLTLPDGKVASYTYTHAGNSTPFTISQLSEGTYTYHATTVLKGKTEESNGQFVVTDWTLEDVTTTADFQLLRTLANQSAGTFVHFDELDQLAKTLIDNKSPDRIDSTDNLAEIIHWKWLFFLLLIFATLEWSIRKYMGGY